MTLWIERSVEERHLFNPSFCSVIVWHAVCGFKVKRDRALPLALSFLVLPFVLHRTTREAFPRSTTTSLATWLAEHPLVRARIPERAVALRPFTREALLFGGVHGLFTFDADVVRATSLTKKAMSTALAATSAEVQACAKSANFLGTWFEKAGETETVLALLGVRP